MHTKQFFVATTFVLIFIAAPALAQVTFEAPADPNDPDTYEASLKAITQLLVIAILIESALEVLFRWPVFRAYFSVSGVKTLINFGVSLLIVIGFEIDVMQALLNVYTEGAPQDSNMGTQALTALIIAGGSSGVNNLLFAFGYRDKPTVEDERPKPPSDKAWIAVRVRRKASRSAVQVYVTKEDRPPSGLNSIAGTCLAGRPSIISLLMRNNNRFPQNGGYAVTPDTAYSISVSATGPDGAVITKEVTSQPVKLAAGAIVDFEVEF